MTTQDGNPLKVNFLGMISVNRSCVPLAANWLFINHLSATMRPRCDNKIISNTLEACLDRDTFIVGKVYLPWRAVGV